jgi:hypothetical protein
MPTLKVLQEKVTKLQHLYGNVDAIQRAVKMFIYPDLINYVLVRTHSGHEVYLPSFVTKLLAPLLVDQLNHFHVKLTREIAALEERDDTSICGPDFDPTPWILTKKTLPPDDSQVFVRFSRYNAGVGNYYPEKNTWVVQAYGSIVTNEIPTHWMRVPYQGEAIN